MKAGAGPYIMATHAAPPQSSILPPPRTCSPACTHSIQHTCAHWNCVFKSVNHENGHKYIYMCVFVSACVCIRVRVVACAVSALMEGEKGGGVDCFQFDIKVQDIAKCRSGLSEHFSKVRKFFPSLSLLLFFFFFASPHNVTPTQLSVRLCVCVCLWFIYVYFWGLATKCQAKKLQAQNFSFVVVLSTVGDLSNCFSFSRLETRFAFV